MGQTGLARDSYSTANWRISGVLHVSQQPLLLQSTNYTRPHGNNINLRILYPLVSRLLVKCLDSGKKRLHADTSRIIEPAAGTRKPHGHKCLGQGLFTGCLT